MSYAHHGRVVPICRTCRCDATAVVAYPDGSAEPYCEPCTTAQLDDNPDALEYPVEEYYTPANRRVSQFTPPDADEFDLFDPDNPHIAWMTADNERADGSSVHLDNWQ